MQRVRRLLATGSLTATTLTLIGVTAYLQLTVHDPRHVLLTSLGLWGVLSIPIGLLVGHAALGEDR